MFYQERASYSPYLDCEVSRLSTCDEHGGPEYFCLVARPPRAKSWRAVKANALAFLNEAMQRGDPPGEIKITQES